MTTLIVKTKVLYETNYKSSEHFQAAIERWEDKGWEIILEVVSNAHEPYAIMRKVEF